jgi:hypothetical protein
VCNHLLLGNQPDAECQHARKLKQDGDDNDATNESNNVETKYKVLWKHSFLLSLSVFDVVSYVWHVSSTYLFHFNAVKLI